MAAPKNNKFWELRSKHGRDKLFATPELLLQAAEEYFNWCDSTPIQANEKTYIRPYTLTGFLIYIDASESYWRDFKSAKHEGFSSVIERVEQIVYTQQFEGATVGMFNANIISRKLGLSEKLDSRLVDKEGEDRELTIRVVTRKEDL